MGATVTLPSAQAKPGPYAVVWYWWSERKWIASVFDGRREHDVGKFARKREAVAMLTKWAEDRQLALRKVAAYSQWYEWTLERKPVGSDHRG